jgi:hypothetical protein
MGNMHMGKRITLAREGAGGAVVRTLRTELRTVVRYQDANWCRVAASHLTF